MTTLVRLPVAPRFLAAKLKAWPRWWSHSSQAPDCHLNQSSLVGGLNPSEKYESQLGLLLPQSSLSYQWLYITGWWYTYPSEKYESQSG